MKRADHWEVQFAPSDKTPASYSWTGHCRGAATAERMARRAMLAAWRAALSLHGAQAPLPEGLTLDVVVQNDAMTSLGGYDSRIGKPMAEAIEAAIEGRPRATSCDPDAILQAAAVVEALRGARPKPGCRHETMVLIDKKRDRDPVLNKITVAPMSYGPGADDFGKRTVGEDTHLALIALGTRMLTEHGMDNSAFGKIETHASATLRAAASTDLEAQGEAAYDTLDAFLAACGCDIKMERAKP